ncbi:MAG: protein-export chaperone SecB [Rickettsiales bacterium]|nr:protein-export chaperone SecB [Rickettsiales bacterium]
MNDKNQTQESEKQKHVQVRGQYIKDLSFESPSAPASLVPKSTAPKIDVNIDLNASALRDDDYEVAIRIETKAVCEDETLFLAELTYGGVFTLHNIPDNEKEGILMIYCPGLLFPYARRVISDTTRDGGFPPLLLDPIDFATLYQKRKAQQNSAA